MDENLCATLGPGTSAVMDEGVIQGPGRRKAEVAARVVVLSPMRIYREGLAHILAQQASVQVVGGASTVDELAPLLTVPDIDVVLFGMTVEGGLGALRRLASYAKVKVVVLGLDDEGPILACARAGIAGYVTQEASLAELTDRIREALDGEFSCSPRFAATLLRSLASPAPLRSQPASAARLTPRESEIVLLIERGLSNKEIARHLTIQLATVKNHVHNILEKLSVPNRADAVRAVRSVDGYEAISNVGYVLGGI